MVRPARELKAFHHFNIREPRSIYVEGAVDGRPGFSTFLDKAEKAQSVSSGVPLLPKWWNEQKRKECEAPGATDAKEWSSLARKVSKDDIQRHYGDISLAMQLRCVGEKVYEHFRDGRKIEKLYVPSYDSDSDDDDLFADWWFEEGFDPLDYKMNDA
ncbi:mynd domain-containing protein [Colletotrichum plurivorum]|uniref:Mynd domain-containing protein n=1 Tax=Colletotrichum plurivorum TaxID=2175906 RepID=A0A8H6NFZ7_9PEZI|nr:mynd domain-containing protein [Colletotrichum plurivorum]